MDSVLPHLELVQKEVSMSTGLLNELINVLEQNHVISSKQREEIYSKATANVPYLLLEHLRDLDRIMRRDASSVTGTLKTPISYPRLVLLMLGFYPILSYDSAERM